MGNITLLTENHVISRTSGQGLIYLGVFLPEFFLQYVYACSIIVQYFGSGNRSIQYLTYNKKTSNRPMESRNLRSTTHDSVIYCGKIWRFKSGPLSAYHFPPPREPWDFSRTHQSKIGIQRLRWGQSDKGIPFSWWPWAPSDPLFPEVRATILADSTPTPPNRVWWHWSQPQASHACYTRAGLTLVLYDSGVNIWYGF